MAVLQRQAEVDVKSFKEPGGTAPTSWSGDVGDTDRMDRIESLLFNEG
jgi:hypothetical protein